MAILLHMLVASLAGAAASTAVAAAADVAKPLLISIFMGLKGFRDRPPRPARMGSKRVVRTHGPPCNWCPTSTMGSIRTPSKLPAPSRGCTCCMLRCFQTACSAPFVRPMPFHRCSAALSCMDWWLMIAAVPSAAALCHAAARSVSDSALDPFR